MKRIVSLSFAIFVGVAALDFDTGSASVKFEKTDDRLFIEWLDLDVNPDPTFGITEYGAYAIVQTGGENLPVIYVIFSTFKGKLFVLGSFACDKEFRVLKSQTRGKRDIRCVRQDGFGRKTTTTLRYNETGRYEEHL